MEAALASAQLDRTNCLASLTSVLGREVPELDNIPEVVLELQSAAEEGTPITHHDTSICLHIFVYFFEFIFLLQNYPLFFPYF